MVIDFDHTCPHRCHLRLAKNFLRFSVLITWALFSIRIIEQKHKDIIRQREIVSYNHTFANKNHLGDKNGRMEKIQISQTSDKSEKKDELTAIPSKTTHLETKAKKVRKKEN